MTRSVHPCSNFPTAPQLCCYWRWCDIDPVEQSKWIWTCSIREMCEQHCRLALICVARECLWSENVVIAGLEVFGGPPGWAPSPVFWHVERLNYRRQTQTIHSALLLASTLLIMLLLLSHPFYFNPQLMETAASQHTHTYLSTHRGVCQTHAELGVYVL